MLLSSRTSISVFPSAPVSMRGTLRQPPQSLPKAHLHCARGPLRARCRRCACSRLPPQIARVRPSCRGQRWQEAGASLDRLAWRRLGSSGWWKWTWIALHHQYTPKQINTQTPTGASPADQMRECQTDRAVPDPSKRRPDDPGRPNPSRNGARCVLKDAHIPRSRDRVRKLPDNLVAVLVGEPFTISLDYRFSTFPESRT